MMARKRRRFALAGVLACAGRVAGSIPQVCADPRNYACCSPNEIISEYPQTIAGWSCQIRDHLFKCPSPPYPECDEEGKVDESRLAGCTGFDPATTSHKCTPAREFVACICQAAMPPAEDTPEQASRELGEAPHDDL